MNVVINTKRLLDKLEKDFPNKIPTSKDVTLASIHRAQGEQRVIAKLKELFEEQDPTEGLLDVFQS